MNDFYKDSLETLETLVKALNGNHGNPRPRRYDTPAKYKNTNSFGRKQYLSTRRKVFPRGR